MSLDLAALCDLTSNCVVVVSAAVVSQLQMLQLALTQDLMGARSHVATDQQNQFDFYGLVMSTVLLQTSSISGGRDVVPVLVTSSATECCQ